MVGVWPHTIRYSVDSSGRDEEWTGALVVGGYDAPVLLRKSNMELLPADGAVAVIPNPKAFVELCGSDDCA